MLLTFNNFMVKYNFINFYLKSMAIKPKRIIPELFAILVVFDVSNNKNREGLIEAINSFSEPNTLIVKKIAENVYSLLTISNEPTKKDVREKLIKHVYDKLINFVTDSDRLFICRFTEFLPEEYLHK